MMSELKPCPFCENVNPELVDSRVEFFVRCNQCKPFFTVVYGKNVRHLDHITAETDEEADRLSEIAFNAVDWDEIKQSAIDAWNARAYGWISVDDELPENECSVLIFPFQNDGDEDFSVTGYIIDGDWFSERGMKVAATHWMPLPATPKSVK